MSAQDNISSEWANREIGALWKRVSKGSGQKYLAGHVKIDELGIEKKLKVIVFQNKFKGDNEKAPDLRIYLTPEDEATASTKTTEAATTADSSQESDLI
tara:strand:- start:74 stop:370 length:297 start_codon:yes stop_codon:yes gene_type:complete